MITIDGEPLLHRTIRLVKKYDNRNDIVVMAYTPEYRVKGTKLHVPDLFAITVHQALPAIYTSYNIWNKNGITVLLFGDVFYTEKAMDRIVSKASTSTEVLFYGRKKGSASTGKPWQEIFAMSFQKTHNEDVLMQLEELKQQFDRKEITRFLTWEIYKQLNGVSLDQVPITQFSKTFINIDDFTDDFDFPVDYDRWINNYNKKKASDGIFGFFRFKK